MRAGVRLGAREPAALVASVRAVAAPCASAAAPPEAYRPVRRLAATATTEVWEATRRGRRYVLKRPAAGAGPTVGAALHREWQLGNALAHPSLLQPVAWLDAIPAIVFDFLPGGDLAALAGAPVVRWARALVDVLAGLEYLHERGLVHRDVKARNVLLDADDRGRLGDLGSCLPAGSRWREAGTTVADRRHPVPERVSPADDLFAFAMLVDELLRPDAGVVSRYPDRVAGRLAVLVDSVRRQPDVSPREKLREFGLVLESAVSRSHSLWRK